MAEVALMLVLLGAVARAAPQPAVSPEFWQAYTAQRAKAAEREATQREATADRAAQEAAELAKQQPWQAPAALAPQGSRPQQYVDLSGTDAGSSGISPQALPKALSFEESARYPRFPSSEVLPPPRIVSGCPDTTSIKKLGAKGDGQANDANAFLAANSRKSFGFIYLPPGNYRISQSVTVTKPIVAGMGAIVTLDKDVTFAITQQPYKWDTSAALFAGEGRPVVTGAGIQLRPSFFKNWLLGESDSMALQQAVDSCAGACTLVLTYPLQLTKAVYLRPSVGVFSSNAGSVTGDGPSSPGEGFVLTPGQYRRPLNFGLLWNFRSFAIKAQGGVTGAQIQMLGLNRVGDGIIFAPNEGSKPTVANVFVTHFTAASDVQNTVAFVANSATQSIQNCLVKGNFVVSPGFSNPTAPSSALVIRGAAAPRLRDASVILQAVEAAQFNRPTSFSMIDNQSGGSLANLVFKCEAWGGGLISGAGKLISGKFRLLKFLARMSGGLPDADFMSRMSGSSNVVTTWDTYSYAGEIKLATEPSRAAFNNGQASNQQVMYVNAPVTGTWLPGATRTFYLYNAYARTAGRRLFCMPFWAANAGLTCASVENQDSAEPGRVAVMLRNSADYALPSWQVQHRFGVQVGP